MYKLFGIAIILMILSVSCAGGGTPRQNNDPIPQSPDQQQQVTPLWIGDGGKGMSLGILMPESQGLNADQAYLPSMVQGVLVSNISKYSTISVLDRVSLDKVIAETLDPTYEDNLDIVRLGHIAHVGNIMTGKIIRTSTGYTLQINVTDTTPNARTIASYSGTCSVAELDNHTAIQKASVELLAQMGVHLTDKATNDLSASNSQSVHAQTALAQGITAQRQGTEVAALSYYFQAVAFDPSLLEAVNRSSVMSANISSGNIGMDARNDIQWRRDWVARLTECEDYFYKMINTGDPPYSLYYSTHIENGTINYQTEKMALIIQMNLNSNDVWFKSLEKAIQTVYAGLNATGRKNDWGLVNWPQQGLSNTNPFASVKQYNFSVVFELVNDRNLVIGRQTINLKPFFLFSRTNNNNNIIIDYINSFFRTLVFNEVKVDDITDSLTIRIASVNGAVPANTPFQITALSGSDQMWHPQRFFWHLRIQNGVVKGFDFNLSSIQRKQYYDFVFPDNAWGERMTSVVTKIDEWAFDRVGLTSVTIPNGITSIGEFAFSRNQLTSIVIPNSVTSIGDAAFSQNKITKITIGANVYLGKYAFSGEGTHGNPFDEFYYGNGRKAGTYTYNSNNRQWR
jgi:hypothetical protein